MPTPDYKPPTSAEELLARYTAGERKFKEVALRGVSLASAVLYDVQLFRADLSGIDANGIDLLGANLGGARLVGADLRSARLMSADLVGADLTDADLRGADLSDAMLHEALLVNAKLDAAILHESVLSNVDLTRATGLDAVLHDGPSTIDRRTLARSGSLPDAFLRGVGLSDWEIANARLLLPDLTPTEITDIMYRVIEKRGAYPLQVRPVFISYNHADAEFVDTLEAELNAVGIRFWRDIHDMDAGPLEPQVHRAMEDRVAVVVLSSASTQSEPPPFPWTPQQARECARRLGWHGDTEERFHRSSRSRRCGSASWVTAPSPRSPRISI